MMRILPHLPNIPLFHNKIIKISHSSILQLLQMSRFLVKPKSGIPVLMKNAEKHVHLLSPVGSPRCLSTEYLELLENEKQIAKTQTDQHNCCSIYQIVVFYAAYQMFKDSCHNLHKKSYIKDTVYKQHCISSLCKLAKCKQL